MLKDYSTLTLSKSSKFHFIEIDWVLYFPSVGNEGRKYLKYGMAFRKRKTGKTQNGVRINLEDVLNETDIKERYPHTVGFYVESERIERGSIPG